MSKGKKQRHSTPRNRASQANVVSAYADQRRRETKARKGAPPSSATLVFALPKTVSAWRKQQNKALQLEHNRNLGT